MADVWGAQWKKVAAGLLREERNAPLLTRLYTTKRWAWPRTRAVRSFRNSAHGHLLPCMWIPYIKNRAGRGGMTNPPSATWPPGTAGSPFFGRSVTLPYRRRTLAFR